MTAILHLIDSYRVGGPAKTILNAARFIDRTRFSIAVAAFTPPHTTQTEFAAAVERARIPFLDLRETGRLNLHHLRTLRAHLRRHHVDVLHTHGYRADVLGYLASRLLPVAVVTTHHGWIRNTRRLRMATALARALCRRFDGVEVVCGALLPDVPPSVRKAGRVAVVHNALVPEDYPPGERRDEGRRLLGLTWTDTLLVVVGRLSVEKGSFEMLDAFAHLAGADPRLHLAFVGDGPIEFELRRRASGHEWSRRIHFLGHCPSVRPMFEAADLVVSPSRSEGLSNVILEAMAFRRPVVATRVGGTPEIVEDGESGLLVEPGYPHDLSSGIRRLLDDDALRERCAENGRRRVLTTFSFEARMRAEERFYEAILRRRAAASPAWSVKRASAVPDGLPRRHHAADPPQS